MQYICSSFLFRSLRCQTRGQRKKKRLGLQLVFLGRQTENHRYNDPHTWMHVKGGEEKDLILMDVETAELLLLPISGDGEGTRNELFQQSSHCASSQRSTSNPTGTREREREREVRGEDNRNQMHSGQKKRKARRTLGFSVCTNSDFHSNFLCIYAYGPFLSLLINFPPPFIEGICHSVFTNVRP